MGPGVSSVRHLGEGAQHRLQVNWADGRMGLLVVGAAKGWLPFHATVVTGTGVSQYQVDGGGLYRSLLEAVLPFLAGEAEKPPVPFGELIEPELCALAARRSWLSGDGEVKLSDLSATDGGYDGAEFAVGYRKMRYPG